MYRYCRICGRSNGGIHRHHVFEGPNRKHSEQYNLVIDLCPMCHTAIHKKRDLALIYKKEYQKKFESEHGHELWMQVFGRNYLDDVVEAALSEMG